MGPNCYPSAGRKRQKGPWDLLANLGQLVCSRIMRLLASKCTGEGERERLQRNGRRIQVTE